MMSSILRCFFTLLLTALLFAPGRAAAVDYSVKFCEKYGLSFADVGVGEDYWPSNASREARGARVCVLELITNVVKWDGYTPTGTDAGCTPTLTLNSARSYIVTVYADAYVNGNYVQVYPSSTGSMYSYSVSHTRLFSTTRTITTPTTTTYHWEVAAAAGYAQYRRGGGISGETYRFYMQACPGSSGSCNSNQDIYIDPATGAPGGNDKFVILHEFGHQMVKRKAGIAGAGPVDYSAPQDGACPTTTGHAIGSKEYQSSAIYEGFAHYYAAVIWNSDAQSDCVFAYYRDWNADNTGTIEYDYPNSRYIDCQGGSHDGFTTVAADYYGDQCEPGASVNNNRGTEFDWLRFFWDLDTEEGLYFTDAITMFADADPATWNKTGDGTGGAYPWARMWSAADAMGFGTEFLNQDGTNGVRH